MSVFEAVLAGGALGVMAFCFVLSVYLALCCVVAPFVDALAALEVE